MATLKHYNAAACIPEHANATLKHHIHHTRPKSHSVRITSHDLSALPVGGPRAEQVRIATGPNPTTSSKYSAEMMNINDAKQTTTTNTKVSSSKVSSRPPPLTSSSLSEPGRSRAAEPTPPARISNHTVLSMQFDRPLPILSQIDIENEVEVDKQSPKARLPPVPGAVQHPQNHHQIERLTAPATPITPISTCTKQPHRLSSQIDIGNEVEVDKQSPKARLPPVPGAVQHPQNHHQIERLAAPAAPIVPTSTGMKQPQPQLQLQPQPQPQLQLQQQPQPQLNDAAQHTENHHNNGKIADPTFTVAQGGGDKGDWKCPPNYVSVREPLAADAEALKGTTHRRSKPRRRRPKIIISCRNLSRHNMSEYVSSQALEALQKHEGVQEYARRRRMRDDRNVASKATLKRTPYTKVHQNRNRQRKPNRPTCRELALDNPSESDASTILSTAASYISISSVSDAQSTVGAAAGGPARVNFPPAHGSFYAGTIGTRLSPTEEEHNAWIDRSYQLDRMGTEMEEQKIRKDSCGPQLGHGLVSVCGLEAKRVEDVLCSTNEGEQQSYVTLADASPTSPHNVARLRMRGGGRSGSHRNKNKPLEVSAMPRDIAMDLLTALVAGLARSGLAASFPTNKRLGAAPPQTNKRKREILMPTVSRTTPALPPPIAAGITWEGCVTPTPPKAYP